MANEIELLGGIIDRAYKDLFSDNIQERTSARLFFRDNPYQIPDYVMTEIEKKYKKDCIGRKLNYENIFTTN